MTRGPTLFILVTCSLDDSRAKVLHNVVQNINGHCALARPDFIEDLIVIDNASTVPGTQQMLHSCFPHVFVSSRNVGYWSAIDWALREHQNVMGRQYDFVYVIESDMVHDSFDRLRVAETFLHMRDHVGAVRCQEYSVENERLYDKDRPLPESRRWAWQSHVHRFTGTRVEHTRTPVPGLWETTFLTQLPALNRIDVVRSAFSQLATMSEFSEPDFQRLCYEHHATNALLDGGIYHCRLSSLGSGTLTGSWSAPAVLASAGYMETRRGSIEPLTAYQVMRA